jgi:hypothetical protein
VHTQAAASPKWLGTSLAVAVLISGWALAPPGQVTAADGLQVTRFDDPVPDGCLPGDCSLREAVRAANASAAADILHLAAGTYVLTLAGAGEDAAATGDLDIGGVLVIEGMGPNSTTLFSGMFDRVLDIAPGATVELRGVNINNGKAGDADGGGVRNLGALTVVDGRIGGNGARDGAGVFSRGSLTLVSTTIGGNEATRYGGGLFNDGGTADVRDGTRFETNVAGRDGGGLYNTGTLTVTNSIVSFNEARGSMTGTGGGLFNRGDGTLFLSDSTIASNLAEGAGGGGIITHGPLTINRTTIAGNRGTSQGGGLMVRSLTVRISNSTFVNNHAEQGGAFKFEAFGERDWLVVNSTITSNDAGVGGGFQAFGELRLQNTILTGNTATSSPNCSADLISEGHNLLGDMTGCDGFTPDPGPDCLTADPDLECSAAEAGLGPFTDNGTPGRGVVPLRPRSPAIDAGDNAFCGIRDTDQLGNTRILDGDGDRLAVCDIGAYEFFAPLDSFNRADGPLGRAWFGPGLDGYTIVNRRLQVGQGGPVLWRPDVFGADQQAFITLVRVDPHGPRQGLLLKAQGQAGERGAIAVSYDAAAGEIHVDTLVPGRGWERKLAYGLHLRPGDQIGARARATGHVNVKINGRDIAEPFDVFFRDRGGRIGLWFVHAPQAVADNFAAATILP